MLERLLQNMLTYKNQTKFLTYYETRQCKCKTKPRKKLSIQSKSKGQNKQLRVSFAQRHAMQTLRSVQRKHEVTMLSNVNIYIMIYLCKNDAFVKTRLASDTCEFCACSRNFSPLKFPTLVDRNVSVGKLGGISPT